MGTIGGEGEIMIKLLKDQKHKVKNYCLNCLAMPSYSLPLNYHIITLVWI